MSEREGEIDRVDEIANVFIDLSLYLFLVVKYPQNVLSQLRIYYTLV